jgi:hypothetical protein
MRGDLADRILHDTKQWDTAKNAAFSGSRRSRRCAAAVRRRLAGDRWFWDRQPSLWSKLRQKPRSTCRSAGSVAA